MSGIDANERTLGAPVSSSSSRSWNERGTAAYWRRSMVFDAMSVTCMCRESRRLEIHCGDVRLGAFDGVEEPAVLVEQHPRDPLLGVPRSSFEDEVHKLGGSARARHPAQEQDLRENAFCREQASHAIHRLLIDADRDDERTKGTVLATRASPAALSSWRNRSSCRWWGAEALAPMVCRRRSLILDLTSRGGTRYRPRSDAESINGGRARAFRRSKGRDSPRAGSGGVLRGGLRLPSCAHGRSCHTAGVSQRDEGVIKYRCVHRESGRSDWADPPPGRLEKPSVFDLGLVGAFPEKSVTAT